MMGRPAARRAARVTFSLLVAGGALLVACGGDDDASGLADQGEQPPVEGPR